MKIINQSKPYLYCDDQYHWKMAKDIPTSQWPECFSKAMKVFKLSEGDVCRNGKIVMEVCECPKVIPPPREVTPWYARKGVKGGKKQ